MYSVVGLDVLRFDSSCYSFSRLIKLGGMPVVKQIGAF